MSTATQTHSHDQIRAWAEQRGGVPARIKGTGSGTDAGLLRIHFPDNSNDDEEFEQLNWDDFFQKLDDSNLDLLYQEKKENGETSTFHKFVERRG